MTDRDPELVFDDWLAVLPIKFLECRVGRHRWPDFSDHKRTSIKMNRRTRSIMIDAPCMRNCGTTMTRYLDSNGFIERSNTVRYAYDPEKDYRMPKAASNKEGLTKDRIARMRRELVTRLTEWITEE